MYLREDGTPYYVGKGHGERAFSKHRRVNAPQRDRIVFPYTNLTEEDAFKKEIELIAQYGRKDNNTGILRNLTNGGEGLSGVLVSEETKKKIALANKGRIYKPHTEEAKAKIRAKRKLQIFTDEYKKNLSEAIKKGYEAGTRKKWMLGRKHTDEHKEHMRQLYTGRVVSEEQKIKISIANKGRKHPPEYGKRISELNKNRKASEKTKNKMADAQRKRWANIDIETKLEIGRKISEKQKGTSRTTEQKQKISEFFKGSIYINNGMCNKRIDEKETIPDGWIKGRLPYTKQNDLQQAQNAGLDNFLSD